MKFNQNMNSSVNLSCVNQTNTWIFVLPANQRDDFDDFKKEDIELTWHAV